jgi:hypothetical protein
MNAKVGMNDHIDAKLDRAPGKATAGTPSGDDLRGSGPAELRLAASEPRGVLSTLSVPARLLASLALAALGVRAALRLELRWDTFAYHLPYAALRGGLSIPYELNDKMLEPYQGYPPLPHLVQGVLWRLTGSMNATGVVNYLAMLGFLAYCHRVLRAPFWLVALISLTAPMVVIHSSVSYVDLFGNSFLAAGAASCLYLFLFPDRASRAVLVGGLLGLVGAAWSKYLLVPVVALLFCVLGVVALRRPLMAGLRRRHVVLLCAAAALLAALPYLKNAVMYGNPFWPIRVPFFGDHLPYLNDAIQGGIVEVPTSAKGSSQGSLFLQSLFETGHPTSYPVRPRWIIDQGNADVAFRMGGFWVVAVTFYLAAIPALLVYCQHRRGAIAAAGVLLVLGFVAILPQSHQLRYYLFIPLSGAAIIGMLFPRLTEAAPRVASVLLVVALGLFVHMVSENWTHYRIERVDHAAAARAWQADWQWPRLKRGKVYCAVDMVPIGMLLTGPTLSEFTIVDRSRAELCPAGSEILRYQKSR